MGIRQWPERDGGGAPTAGIAVQFVHGCRSSAAKLTCESLLRNHDIAAKFGCLHAADLAEMRRGKSPTVQKGSCKGQELSVDHIVARAVVPNLDNVIANLELLPLKLNEKKNDKVGDRQLSHAQKLYDAGLLRAEALRKAQRAGRGRLSP